MQLKSLVLGTVFRFCQFEKSSYHQLIVVIAHFKSKSRTCTEDFATQSVLSFMLADFPPWGNRKQGLGGFVVYLALVTLVPTQI